MPVIRTTSWFVHVNARLEAWDEVVEMDKGLLEVLGLRTHMVKPGTYESVSVDELEGDASANDEGIGELGNEVKFPRGRCERGRRTRGRRAGPSQGSLRSRSEGEGASWVDLAHSGR